MRTQQSVKNIQIASLSLLVTLLFTAFVYAGSNFTAAYSVSNVTITANLDGSVNVLQSFNGGATADISVQALSDNTYNVIATDESGAVLFTTVEGSNIVIDALGAEKVNLSYFVDDLLTSNGDLWSMSFTSDYDAQIILPPSAEIIYISDIPLYENNGMLLMQAGLIEIDYVLKNVRVYDFVVSSDGNDHVMQVSSAAEIEDFRFVNKDQMVSFTVTDANVPVTIIMPKALLEAPFVALLNGNSITHSKYLENSTHTWITIESNDVGTLSLLSGTIIPEFETADVRVIAKMVSDLVLIRVTNDNDSTASIYGLTVRIQGADIQAFKGPREWSRSGASSSLAESSTADDPIIPSKKAVFKMKIVYDDQLIKWKVHDLNGIVLDQGEVKPLSFKR